MKKKIFENLKKIIQRVCFIKKEKIEELIKILNVSEKVKKKKKS